MTVKKETFEDKLSRLKDVVRELEGEEVALEKGVALYKEGLNLVKACREQLKNAEHEIRIATQDMPATMEQSTDKAAEDEDDDE